MHIVSASADGIEIGGYPFPPASVYPGGVVPITEIAEIDSTSAPPELRLRSGEVLFVTAEQKLLLQAWARKHGVPEAPRTDVWGLLLEPFLDTELSEEVQQRTVTRLLERGFSRSEIERLRGRFGPAMIAYNIASGLWDWVHLGAFDLLQAHMGKLAGETFRCSPEELEELYWMVMRLSARG